MSSRRRRRGQNQLSGGQTRRARTPAGGPRDSGPTFGDELRRDRELRGISLREVAEATKISLRYLQALESNRFDLLPGGVFNKGFVKAYAQFVGLDPEATVNAYVLEERSARTEAEPEGDDRLLRELARAGDRRNGGDAARGSTRRRILWGAVASVLVVAAGVLALVWLWPGGEAEPTGDSAPIEAAPPVVPADLPARDAAPVPEPEEGATVEDEGPPATADDRPTTPEELTRKPVEESRPEAGPVAPGDSDLILARVVIDRSTTGQLNCDNQRVEVLDGLPVGTVLELRCRRYLVLHAADGGGVRVGLSGAVPTALVADGVPLRGYRILPPGRGQSEREGANS